MQHEPDCTYKFIKTETALEKSLDNSNIVSHIQDVIIQPETLEMQHLDIPAVVQLDDSLLAVDGEELADLGKS